MLRTKPDGKGGFDENSYRAPDEVNAFRWETLGDEDHAKTVDYYRGLIAFRKAHDVLRLKLRKDVVNAVDMLPIRDSKVVVFKVHDEKEELLLIFSASEEAVSVALPEGNWNVCIQDDVAGTDTLSVKSESVEVAPISASVLVKA